MRDEKKTKEQLVSESVEPRQRAEQTIPERRTWLPVIGMFVLLCVLVWLDEIVDIPHLLLGAPRTPINWQEALLEMVLIVAAGLFAVSNLVHVIKRRRAEKALRESEQEYRTMIEQSNDMIWTLDTQGNFTFFNQRSEEFTGHRLEDWRGKSFAPLVVEEDLPLVMDVFHSTLDGEPQHYEARVKKHDGDILVLSVNTAPILKAGEAVGTVSFGRDITERVRAEETLRESEDRYRLISELTSDITYAVRVEPDGTVVREWIAGALSHITGFTLDELAARGGWKSLMHPDDMPIALRHLQCHLSGQPDTSEYRIVTKSGETRWLRDYGHPVWDDAQDRVVRIIGAAQDITERKRAERESEERRLYLESVLACAPDAIVALDGQHNILEWNRGAERLFGYTSKEVVGRNLDDLITGSDANTFKGATGLTRQVLAGGSVPAIETVRYRKDGSPVDVMVSGSSILVGDEVAGVVAVYTDITARKRVEQQLRQQERLAAVGELAAGIAHDFNNLLTTIMLYAQMGLGKHDLHPELRQALETILGESQQAAKLVQQILDFSRRSPIEIRSVDLKPFIEETVRVLQRTIPESIRLHPELGAGGHMVRADPTRIQQALMNLAVNGRDAMLEGGELRIDLSRVEVAPGEEAPVAGMPPGEWVCLAVSDTGMGMAKEVRARLFEPFFTTKPRGRGTGLGLAQVYGIVKQHEGHINVETEVGEGTTFRIYLPACGMEAMEDVRAEKASAPPQGKGETILLVEDEEKLREVGQGILESLGYRVLTAANGREALAAHRSAQRVDLLLTDLVMPEMGGKRLFRELRKITPALKALVITGYIAQEDLEGLREEGFLDVVHKPFDVDTLATVVRRALDVG